MTACVFAKPYKLMDFSLLSFIFWLNHTNKTTGIFSCQLICVSHKTHILCSHFSTAETSWVTLVMSKHVKDYNM